MSFGADLSAMQIKQTISQSAAQFVAFLKNFQGVDAQLNDLGLDQIRAAYAQQYQGAVDAPTRAEADVQGLTSYLSAVEAVAAYATQTVTVTPTDNTAKDAAEATVSVPVGSYALVTSDPTAILILRNLGDKGRAIRAAAPLGA